ncbi:calcyphosin-like protein isoform X1 [Gigantopelta aegis]|uniref:calcyphosin-like protein isoform X1 n=1 Tax=Gigantopelta aegis TaxID=1735272 RepID=UPI001B888A42|nr:calcyphosin-like protein isoform X1 [Gigantopelta aegis]XP_041363444.1 calcyphosin-like protein isoform X1 [Gigantopelta aegis]
MTTTIDSAEVDSNVGEQLIEVLRSECLSRGCGGIRGLGLMFRHLDIDFSKRIVLRELEDGLKLYGFRMSENYLKALFRALDKDNSGGIDFCEFMQELRPPMTSCRINVINEAFDSLDVNKDGIINMDDIKVVYAANARRHPKYLSGEWTEEDTLRHFLDSIDTPGCPDGKVTREEFLNYYAGVSATVDDDCYFDLVMRSCYNLPPRKTTNS